MSATAIISVLFALAILIAIGLVSRRVWVDLREERRRGLNRGAAAPVSDAKAKACLKVVAEILLGLSPGISFLIGYLAAPVPEREKIYIATAVFMAVAVALTLANRIRKRKLRPWPWSTLLIVAMGGLTLWLQDDLFIKIRPTLLFTGVAVFAASNLVKPSSQIQKLLGKYALRFGASGQRHMVLIVVVFGSGMALINEVVWRNSSDLFWIGFQIWGPILGFALFALPIVVMMVRRDRAEQRKTEDIE